MNGTCKQKNILFKVLCNVDCDGIMNCPCCKAQIDISVRRCPFCGIEIETKGRSQYGKASLIFPWITAGCLLGIFFCSIFRYDYMAFNFLVFLFSILCYVLPVASIISGAIAYFGKDKDKNGLTGVLVGSCLLFCMPVLHYVALNIFYFLPRQNY